MRCSVVPAIPTRARCCAPLRFPIRSLRAPAATNRSKGEIPSPLFAPSGCVFRTRCPLAIDRCAVESPLLRRIGDSEVACHRAEELLSSDADSFPPGQ